MTPVCRHGNIVDERYCLACWTELWNRVNKIERVLKIATPEESPPLDEKIRAVKEGVELERLRGQLAVTDNALVDACELLEEFLQHRGDKLETREFIDRIKGKKESNE